LRVLFAPDGSVASSSGQLAVDLELGGRIARAGLDHDLLHQLAHDCEGAGALLGQSALSRIPLARSCANRSVVFSSNNVP
jgi:hypothetical protein